MSSAVQVHRPMAPHGVVRQTLPRAELQVQACWVMKCALALLPPATSSLAPCDASAQGVCKGRDGDRALPPSLGFDAQDALKELGVALLLKLAGLTGCTRTAREKQYCVGVRDRVVKTL